LARHRIGHGAIRCAIAPYTKSEYLSPIPACRSRSPDCYRPTLHGHRLQRFPRLIESRPQFGEGDAEQRMAAVAGYLGQRPQDKGVTGDFIAGELQAIFAQRQVVGRQPGANRVVYK
jgi:hypothetical protein